MLIKYFWNCFNKAIHLTTAFACSCNNTRLGRRHPLGQNNVKCVEGILTFTSLHRDAMMIRYDDVIKCKHFPRYWSFVRGIHRWPVDSPHKGQWSRAFGVFFYLRLNKRLSKQTRRRWFETPSCSLWRHCNGNTWWKLEGISYHRLCCTGVRVCAVPIPYRRNFMNHFTVYQ